VRPCLFISADFGLLKFRHFIFANRGGCFMPGARLVVTMAFYPGVELSHLKKIYLVKTTGILVCGQKLINLNFLEGGILCLRN
jgi:hypothetical protein